MRKLILFLLVVGCGLQVAGCGVFRSSVDRSETSDVKRQTERSEVVREIESLSADIPVQWIDYVETASGMRVQLRDSVAGASGQSAVGSKQSAGSPAHEASATGDSSSSDGVTDHKSNTGSSSGGVSIDYERETEETKEVSSETESSETSDVKRETEIDTGLGWLVWLLAGLVAAFAVVIGGYLFFRVK